MNLLKDPRTNWKYILIVVVLAAIVGGGILGYQYWWLPRQEVEMPEIEIPERKPSEEGEVPADWKTYRNEEYGFEVKYPPDCVIEETSPVPRVFGAEEIKQVSIFNIEHCNLTIEVYTNPNNLSLEQWLDLPWSIISEVGIDLIKKEPISIDGTSGFKGLLGCCMSYTKGVALSKGNRVYVLSGHESIFMGPEEDLWLTQELTESDDIYNKIISTLKFLE